MSRLLLLLLLLAPTPAFAVPDPVGGTAAATPATNSAPKTTADLLADLRGEDNSNRLYAARSLKSGLRRALAVEARGREGTLAVIEARSFLFEMESRLPEACVLALEAPNTVTPCADMLAWMEVRTAVPALEARLAVETRRRARRHLEAALQALRGP